MRPLAPGPTSSAAVIAARIGDAEARIVADHLETRHPTALDTAVDFDDPGPAAIFHHVRVTSR